jgi:two-component system response regulator
MKLSKLTSPNEIVFVDDDKAELMIATRYLQKSTITNNVLTFISADDFLNYMNDVKSGSHKMPAIVFLDVRMPKMDGFEVLEKLRGEKEFQEFPPVVMLSNSDAPSDIRKAHEKGANAYKTKFPNGEEFIAFFNSLIAAD